MYGIAAGVTHMQHKKLVELYAVLVLYLYMAPFFNPLPHGVLATFYPTARGLMGPPKKDDISREKTILMTSLRTQRASAVSSPGFHYTHPPLPPAPLRGHCVQHRHHITA
jgi:hypothetical protein